MTTPRKPRVTDTKQGDLKIAPEMDWEDVPDTEKA